MWIARECVESAIARRDNVLAPVRRPTKSETPSQDQRGGSGGVPRGIRTLVSDVKSRGPGPLDDGDEGAHS